jgi:hypothetical protein
MENQPLKIKTQQDQVKEQLEKLGHKVIVETVPEKPESAEDPTKDKNDTETQLANLDITKFDVMGEIYIDKPAYLVLELKHLTDYNTGVLHYVPYTINEGDRHLYNNKKYCIRLYANADTNVQRRLKKLIKRHWPMAPRPIELTKIHDQPTGNN